MRRFDYDVELERVARETSLLRRRKADDYVLAFVAQVNLEKRAGSAKSIAAQSIRDVELNRDEELLEQIRNGKPQL